MSAPEPPAKDRPPTCPNCARLQGREFKGVLTSDCFTAYDAQALREWVQQKCLAHLIRTASELEKHKTRGAVRFPRAVAALLREALALAAERPGPAHRRAKERMQGKRLIDIFEEAEG